MNKTLPDIKNALHYVNEAGDALTGYNSVGPYVFLEPIKTLDSTLKAVTVVDPSERVSLSVHFCDRFVVTVVILLLPTYNNLVVDCNYCRRLGQRAVSASCPFVPLIKLQQVPTIYNTFTPAY